MKTISALFLVLSMGCASSIQGADTTTILSSQNEVDPLLVMIQEKCSENSAHVTRAQLGNRPIVVDGVSFYCF